jgi:subtilisin family serine protease
MLRKLVLVVLALVALSIGGLLATGPTWAQARRPEYKPGELIIKFKNNADPAGVSALLSELGATRLRSFTRIQASHVRISQLTVDQAIARYGKNPLIEFIEPNYIFRAEEIPDDPMFDQLWGLRNTGQTGGTPGADIQATTAWDIFTGTTDVLVAIIDTGVDYTHPDLAANIYSNPSEIPGNGIDDDGNGFVDDVRGWDFVNDDNDPADDNGHGTHVAGTIGALGDNGIGVTGVNWHVSILPVKFLNAGGSGTTADAVSCVEYATMMQARVTNNSWGGGGYSEALRQAILEANNAEILFVAAAGNSASNNDLQPHYPSSYDLPNIIAVAATNHYDALAGFSCYGVTSVDLAAPGETILSCAPGGFYATKDGTSMATPHVVGVCALVMGLHPNISAAEAKELVLSSTDPLPSLAGQVLTGGRLNAFRAIAVPDSIPPAPVSDLLLFEANGDWVELRWTATGDDSLAGTARHYDIRYSPDPITESNFGGAIEMSGEPDPLPSGSPEHARVTGLAFDTDYCFALKVRDEIGNESTISNVVSGRTLLPPVIGVSPDSLSDALYTGQVSTHTLTIRNTGSSELAFRAEGGGYSKATGSWGGPDRAALHEATSSVSRQSASAPLAAFVPPVGHQPAPASAPPPTPGSATLQRLRERLAGIRNDRIIFRDDMESGDNGWTKVVYQGEDLWHQTLLSYNSPVHSWWCGRESQGTYETGSRVNTAVISPTINLVSIPAPITLTFNESYDTERTWDFCMVDASVDGGTTWTQLRGGLGTAPNGSSGGWIETNLDLSGFAGEMLLLRFYFDTIDGGVNGFPGWFFDDVIVHGQGWFRTSPAAGVVPVGQTVDLTVTIDATGLYGGDYTAVLSIFSNDPVQPRTDVPVLLQVTGAPDLEVTPDLLSFDAVFIGGSRTDTVEVRNVGTDLLTVTSLSTDNPQEFLVDGSGFTLAPASARQVLVTYVPLDTGSDGAILTIESDDPDRPSWQLPMSGEGILPPDISVTPDSLFADLFTGGVETQVVTINNTGVTDLIWSASGQATRLPRRTYSLPERSGTGAEAAPNETRREGVPGHDGPAPPMLRELSDLSGVRILWDLSHGQMSPYNWSILVADLVLRGAEVVESGEPLTSSLLSQFDLFWTVDSYMSWTPGEMDALVQWVAAGGGLLIESDQSGDIYNQILSLMGAGIAFVSQAGGSGLTTAIYPHQTTESIAGLNYGNPLSILSPVESPAVLLVRNSASFPVTACVQAGLGRVLVASDEIFGDWDVILADNRQFGNQVCDWLAGGLWLDWDPTSGVVSPGGGADLRVTFDASGLHGGDYLSTIVISSNDPDEPEVPVPALLHVTDAPELAISDSVLAFGPVYIGASRSDTLVVSNQGTTLLTVSAVATDNQVEFSVDGAGFTLAPGESRLLPVTYIPANAGSDSAALTIESSDPDEPVVTVALLGEGVPPPDIAVEPDSVYVELLTGETATRTLTVTNSGETDLAFEIAIRDRSGLARAGFSRRAARGEPDKTSTATVGASLSEAVEGTLYDDGRVGHLPGVGPNPMNLGPPRSGTAKVVILVSGGDVQPIRDLLRMFPDLTQVDVLSLSSGSPSLAFLLQYDSAVLMISSSSYDPYALGDVLADYVDAGGGVVMTVASFVSNWAVRGRFLAEGYSPFAVGTGPVGSGELGNYNAAHPIMSGVQTAQADARGDAALAPGAEWVASFSDGVPFIATKGNQVAAVNVFAVFSGNWAGDIPLILHNAIRWSQPVSWLTADPLAGVVPPGGSVEISMLFDPGDLLGGDYHAVVEVSSNDPDESVIEIPAHLHLTGVPDIEVSDGVMDFGPVYIGASRTDTLFVSNPGTGSLIVDSIASGNPVEFLVDGAGFTIPPRETRGVLVTYVPVDPGSDDFVLTIESNDLDEPTVTVGLLGEGVPPPDIAVEPDSVSADLLTGETTTRIVTVTNSGQTDLRFDITMRGDQRLAKALSRRAPADAGTEAGPSYANGDPTPGDDHGSLYNEGHPGTLPGTDREHLNLGPPRTGAVNVVILDSGGSVQPLRDLLLAFPDFALVDVRELGYGIPSLDDLVAYDAAIVTINSSGYDAFSLGNVLADYVDAGGTVVTTVSSFVSNWAIRGRFGNEGYSPFTVAPGFLSYHVLGNYDAGHPIMSGVSAAGADIPGAVQLTPGATWVASFSDGVPFVATKGAQVVAVNAFVAWPGNWSGDVPLILHNAVRWGRGLPWLSAEPNTGVLAPGASLDVSLLFDPGDLWSGEYHGTVMFSSNDPDEPIVRVDASLHVTGVPDLSVGGEPVTLESTASYYQSGDQTTHALAVTVTPASGGSILLRADGNYGYQGETATLVAEGRMLGTVGPTGIDCSAAEGTFVIAPADLAALVADGVVNLTVQNSNQVDAYCLVNQHRVQLRYAGYSDSLDFGRVFVGLSRVIGLQISNVGTDVLEVNSITTDPDAFTAGAAQMSIAPGESQTLSVTFHAVGAGVVQGTLILGSNDPDEGEVTLALRGEGQFPPEIRVSPSSFAEQIPSGEQSTHTLTIGNDGAGGLDWSVTPSYTSFGRVLYSSPLIPSTGVPRTEKEPAEPTLRRPPPEQLYLFPSPGSPTSAESSTRAPAAAGDKRSRNELSDLETVLANLDAGYPAVIGAIPNRFDFSEGEFGSSIGDGGNDMYDGGNYLGTGNGGPVEYSNGLIASNPAFGVPGRYFTRKYPGLFVLVADLQNVQDFYIWGDLGADGMGSVDGAVLQTEMFGVTYLGFVKRVFNAYDPSVNHLIIVEYGPTLSHGFSTNTNDDFHIVSGLGAATRIYSLLYAGSGGSYIDDSAALSIMGAFLDAAGLVPRWLAVNPESGHVAPSDSVGVAVTVDATELPAGYYAAQLRVRSNDPLAPEVPIPVDLHVTAAAARFIRGDDDGSGEVNISDPIYSLVHQFAGGPSLCFDAHDTNDDGRVNISDPIHNLAYQFGGGPEPPAPFPACGTDPTADSLDCWSHPFCDGTTPAATPHPEGEEMAVTLTLGEVFSIGDGEVGYPVRLETDLPLWGFEYTVRCLPAGPAFVGVAGSGCDYSHGQMDPAGGRVRVGNVFRFSLSEALSPGAHGVGYLSFHLSQGYPAPALEFIEGTYVAEGGGSGPIAGGSTPSSVWDAVDIPDRLVCRVAPNPFGQSTVVHYSMPAAGLASVEIYGATGQRIRRLSHAETIRGWHEATWDGTTEAGKPVAGGIYFVRVRAAGETKTERLILLK